MVRLPKMAYYQTRSKLPRPSAYVQAQSLNPERVPGLDWLNSEKRCSLNVRDWLNGENAAPSASVEDPWKVLGRSVEDPLKGSYCHTGSYCLVFPIQVLL